MTHQQRLNEIAKKMAEARRIHLIESEPRVKRNSWNEIGSDTKAQLISSMLPLAEICVAEMAEIGSICYLEAFAQKENDGPYVEKQYLQSLGLIPQ